MAGQICWICGGVADTGEHKTKRTDLLEVFGQPSQQSPLIFNSVRHKNIRIGGLNSKRLKSPSLICASCNNHRSQPYDRAWEKLSHWLRENHKHSKAGTVVRADRVFQYNTALMMLNVHLYFVKVFGCHIKEGNIPIDLTTLSTALLQAKAHPLIYLKFGCGPALKHTKAVGMSDISTITATDTGKCVSAVWYYYVDQLAVMVMFFEVGQKRAGLLGSWHPSNGTNKLVLSDLS